MAKNYAGTRFFNFLNFFTIFLGIFLPESSINGIQDEFFFFLFFGLSCPVLAKNIAGMRFFNFLILFFLFFRNCLLGSIMNGIREENFFLAFSAYLIPFWLKIMPERGFLIFWIFLLFFSQFSFPGGVWMEVGIIIFLYLSLHLSTRFR